MATISIAATGVTTRSKTISTNDTQRLLNAFRKVYGQVSDGAGGMRDMTDQEIFNRFADGVFESFITTTYNAELGPALASAEAAARASVTPIVFT